MHSDNPFVPAPIERRPLTTEDALPIAVVSAVPILASLAHGLAAGPLLGGLASAGVFFAGAMLVLRHGRPGVASCLTGGALAGAASGVAWWALMDTPRSLGECVTRAALGGAAVLAFELYRAWRRRS